MDIRGVSKLAKEIIIELTDQPFDSIALCEAKEDGWRVVVDVIESRARMGDDDVITVYQLDMDVEGALKGYRRLGRRKRFDDASSAA